MTLVTNFPALKAEITNDPTGKGYASMTPAQVAAAINSDASTVDVPSGIISKDLFLVRAMPALSALWAMSPTSATYIAFTPWLNMLGMANTIDTGNASITGAVAAAVSATLLTSAQATACLNDSVLRTVNLFGGPVTVDDILTAERQG